MTLKEQLEGIATTTIAAAHVGVSWGTLRVQIEAGVIDSETLGGVVFVRLADVETWATLRPSRGKRNAQIREDVAELVESADLSVLPERTRTILQRRFGLNDGSLTTLKEIGADLGLTSERVRQIENYGIRRLLMLKAEATS